MSRFFQPRQYQDMPNRVTRRSPLSPSVYLANGSHSSATTFSNHTAAQGKFSWQWPKWSCELDAFCNSAKKVIRDLGSVLQSDHDELAQFEFDYFLRSGIGSASTSSEVYEFSEGVGDSDSAGGGYLSDVSLDYSHGPTAQRSFIASRNNEVEAESYPPRRASPRFSEGTDSTVSLEASAYCTDLGYQSDNEEGEESYFEGRGRPLRGEMAGSIVAALVQERKRSKAEKAERKDKAVHKQHEDPEEQERERRRAERRKRRLEREERKEREALEEAEKAERRQQRLERRQLKEATRAQKSEVGRSTRSTVGKSTVGKSTGGKSTGGKSTVGRPEVARSEIARSEVTVKEKAPKLTVEEIISGIGRSRSMSARRQAAAPTRPTPTRSTAVPPAPTRPTPPRPAAAPPAPIRATAVPLAPPRPAPPRPTAAPPAPPAPTRPAPPRPNSARLEVRPKLTIKRSRSTVLMKSQEKSKDSAKERHRHRDHHDHSTPEARANCARCLRKREKKENLEKIKIVPLQHVREETSAKTPAAEKIDEKAFEEKIKEEVELKKKTKPVLGFVIEKKPEKLVECVTCLADDVPVREAAKLSCGHYWCNDCLKRIFTLSLTDPAHMPPKCCNDDHVPLKHVDKLLNYQTKKLWNKKYIEYTTSNRIYCPKPNCGEWIQPKEIQNNVGKCSQCKTKVCAMCNGKAHGDGECPKDEDLMKFIETAKKNKFQRCYSCRAMVELERGCNHMTCRCTAEFCYVCGDKWKTCKCPWFNYEPEDEDEYIVPVWNANEPAPPIPANVAERREQRARARAEQMRQDEELARRLAQEEGPLSPVNMDEYFPPSPIQIDPLAALGTIGSGLRDGIRRIAADYVETATRATPQPRATPIPRLERATPIPRLDRRRTSSMIRTAPRTRSREEIRENISNLIQEVEELEERSRSPQRPRPTRVETAPELRTPRTSQTVLMQSRENSPISHSRYLSGAQQAHIEEYLRGIDLEDPEPVAPPLPSPHEPLRTYDLSHIPELRRSRTERIPRRRRGDHDFAAEYTAHTPSEVVDRMSRMDVESRVGTESRLGTESRVGTEATFMRRPSASGSRLNLAENRWRYTQQHPAFQARMPVETNLGAWRWGAETRGY